MRRKSTAAAIVIFTAFITALFSIAPEAALAKEIPRDLLIINKSTNQMAYYQNGKFVKVFSVGTGRKPEYTPEGTFTIVNKIKNRPYYKEKIKGGDPKNPLGDRWLGLDVDGTKGTVYAIHGNADKSSIGKYVSAGCVRMYNEEVRWLYDEVKVGAVVIITSSDSSFEELAKAAGYDLPKQVIEGSLTVDGQRTSVTMQQYENRMHISVRAFVAAAGGALSYEAKSKTITVRLNGTELVHVIGSPTVNVDGQTVSISGQSYLSSDTTMIPVRDFAELAGYRVGWNGRTHDITLTSNKKRPAT